jgi:hypothetical protein
MSRRTIIGIRAVSILTGSSDVPFGFFEKWRRRMSEPSGATVDKTLLIGRIKDGDFEAAVDLAKLVDARTVTELVLVVSPAGMVTPLTFDLLCGAFEYVGSIAREK